jgi:hypothetical protein
VLFAGFSSAASFWPFWFFEFAHDAKNIVSTQKNAEMKRLVSIFATFFQVQTHKRRSRLAAVPAMYAYFYFTLILRDKTAA